MNSKQTSFFDKSPIRSKKGKKFGRKRRRPLDSFGGKYFQNYNPSMQRPIKASKALHLVLKSSLAEGQRSFKSERFEEKIWQIIERHANLNGIQVYSYSNAGNHLHLLLRVKRRDAYCRFIRSITGLIARLIGKTERGRALGRKFWDGRPFSRVVGFAGDEFKKVKSYLFRNDLEAIGWIRYIRRSKRLSKQWKDFWYWTAEVPQGFV